MNLEPVIQSEVNQKGKNKYPTLMDIYGIQKLVLMNLVVGRNRDANTENGLVDTVGEGKSGMNGESSINIYTLSCIKQILGKKLLHKTGGPA